MALPDKWKWFADARFGMFIHWGPYAALSRGEQVLFREQLDPADYARAARAWNPRAFDARQWAQIASEGGFRYAVLTTRHHDGYCLWDSKRTDYTSVQSAPRRDFVREYVEAFRAAGLRVGLYYSLADWRVPAYFDRPDRNPTAFGAFIDDIHAQVRELLTDYGQIDEFWFDGAWPHSAKDWRSLQLVEMMRALQPNLLINNRLDSRSAYAPAPGELEAAGQSTTIGDFGTPEHHITADAHRPWESCQTSTHRLWGYAEGEHWRTTEQWLDMLCEAAAKGGNLLLNVGPDGEGRIPQPFIERSLRIGRWLSAHREAISQTQPNPTGKADITEFVTRGYQTARDDRLYLILRFWHGGGEMRMADLDNRVRSATLLCTGQSLEFSQDQTALVIRLPREKPCDLYPIVRLDLDGRPRPKPFMRDRLWTGDPSRFVDWASRNGRAM